jgi:hypothetical protein
MKDWPAALSYSAAALPAFCSCSFSTMACSCGQQDRSGRNRHEILSDKSRLPCNVNDIYAQHMRAFQAAQLEANT